MPVKTEQGIIDGGVASVAALGLNYVDLFLIHAPFAFLEGTEAGLAQWRGLSYLLSLHIIALITLITLVDV